MDETSEDRDGWHEIREACQDPTVSDFSLWMTMMRPNGFTKQLIQNVTQRPSYTLASDHTDNKKTLAMKKVPERI